MSVTHSVKPNKIDTATIAASPTLQRLREHADALLFAGEHARALFGYVAVVRMAPGHLEARLRIADTLLALGQVQRAAEVYAEVARSAAHGGYPLIALVAILVLITLEPQLAQLLESFASLYAADSNHVGRGARRAFGDMDATLPAGFSIPDNIDLAPLIALATQSASAPLAPVSEKVPPVPLLSQLAREPFLAVLRSVSLRRLRAGDVVFQEGEQGRSFFVVARGSIEVQRTEGGRRIALAQLGEGAIFGEMSILSDTPRSASVLAKGDVDVLEFDRDALLAVPEHLVTISHTLSRFAVERVLTNLICTSPLFLSLRSDLRRELLQRFSQHEVAAGTDLIRQDETGRGLFVLVAGKLEVIQERTEAVIARLSPGDIFGEMSLVFAEPTSATVRATQPAMVLFLDRETFMLLLDRVPQMREYVLDLAETRKLDTELANRTLRVDDWSENSLALE